MRTEREVLAVWVDCRDGAHVAAVQSARLDVVRRLREMAGDMRAGVATTYPVRMQQEKLNGAALLDFAAHALEREIRKAGG